MAQITATDFQLLGLNAEDYPSLDRADYAARRRSVPARELRSGMVIDHPFRGEKGLVTILERGVYCGTYIDIPFMSADGGYHHAFLASEKDVMTYVPKA